MNCPSRTDDTLPHCDWNQNPPFLAPDLTTRQDLNGISNAREFKEGAGVSGMSRHCLHDAELPCSHNKSQCDGFSSLHRGASLTPSGRPNIHKMDSRHSSFDKVKSWLLWLLSVLCTAVFISTSGLIDYLTGSIPITPSFSRANMASSSIVSSYEPADAVPVRPTRGHTKRQTCASGGVDGAVYNTSLHVGALFIILGVSFLACALPILIIRFSRLHIPASFLFFVRHFGTGVLIATAFAHLLPTAFTLLGNQCLSSFWTDDYPAMPGAIALGGIFLVTLIEMVFSPVRHATRRIPSKSDDQEAAPEVAVIRPHTNPVSATGGPGDVTCQDDCASQLRPKGPLVGRSSSFSRAIHRIGEESDRIYRISSAPEVTPLPQVSEVKQFRDRQGSLQDEFQLSEKQKHNKDVMQVFMLEVGILFHSVFIGMSLSVSVGNEFVVLLIAIVFHQTFEGLALGSRIACLNWPATASQPWLMSLAYGCTTPIGQAIGIATHSLYSPDSEVGLLLVGTMNAISAGLLIFASLVELLSEDFLSDESWRVLRGRKRVFACVLVFGGAFCMSLVGAWA
ncbi:ZIP zinc transporter-domain-containing protein [Aspergillus pseudoustus]|uniref:ZIP zinc transporter-domain-containing protein n=1 Tax=Aspergillus pseudoustus TaxID=1810923 RepID=A0ABR4J282_9EURO